MGIIVFLGDSITDAGRMTSDNPLGNGMSASSRPILLKLTPIGGF